MYALLLTCQIKPVLRDGDSELQEFLQYLACSDVRSFEIVVSVHLFNLCVHLRRQIPKIVVK